MFGRQIIEKKAIILRVKKFQMMNFDYHYVCESWAYIMIALLTVLIISE